MPLNEVKRDWLNESPENKFIFVTVAIVQLVRTPGCGPGGRGFNSHWSPKKIENKKNIFIYLPLSSRGRGHGLFKPGTRVRISLGAQGF